MAFSKNRRLADLITANAEQFITSAHVTDAAIVPGDLHATLDLTGKTITVANASTGDSDTTVANTAFVQQEIAALVDSSPSALNTLNELANALGDDENFSTTVNASIAAKLATTGGTMTGQISFGDNVKANFGASNDLQIYHDSSNSYIAEVGTGDLIITSNSAIRPRTDAFVLNNAANSENMITAVADGSVILYHNGSPKLATTSGGVTVTGTLTSTGLNSTSGTVEFADGSSAFDSSNSNGYPVFTHTNGSAQIGFARAGGSTGIGYIGADSTYNLAVFDSSFSKKMVLTQTGNVGIGETSPAATLHVEHSSGTAYDSAQEPTESMIVSNKNGTDNSGVDNVASIGLHVADGATSQGFVNYARTGNNTGRFSFTQRNGSSSYIESLSLTGTGLHTTGGLHEIHSSNPNNFVAGAASDQWIDLNNYNYQNAHNGPGVDHTAQTITQLIWQNSSANLGYIVRMYVIHGAYSANTHTIYSSAGTDSVLDGGSSFAQIYPSKYDTAGNGGVVYATLHTASTALKLGVRFNNHTNANYGALTMQVKTNGPPAAGTTPIMRVWRI